MISYGFVFARGGSKGLPRKNVKLLAGKPLLQYSIETALDVDNIEKVFVSTDDPEISNIAKKSGAIVIDRPLALAQDKSSEWSAWQHAIQWVEEHYGVFDEFISLPATSPLRSAEDVINSIDKRRTTGADFCISVTPATRSPYFNMVKNNDNGYIELVNKPKSEEIFRRQDAPEVFDITTVCYVSTPQFIFENTGLFDGNVTSVEVPKERAVDIDDIYDFMFAETLVRGLEKC